MRTPTLPQLARLLKARGLRVSENGNDGLVASALYGPDGEFETKDQAISALNVKPFGWIGSNFEEQPYGDGSCSATIISEIWRPSYTETDLTNDKRVEREINKFFKAVDRKHELDANKQEGSFNRDTDDELKDVQEQVFLQRQVVSTLIEIDRYTRSA